MGIPLIGLQRYQGSHMQGSILGPLLFILYINDLPSAICSPIKIFADDVAMHCSVQSNSDCSVFQHDLDLIAAWCSKWQMGLNLSRCEPLCISNKYSSVMPLCITSITIISNGFYL